MSIQIDYQQAIRENYHSLGKKKQKIADLLLKSPMLVLEKSLGELAELCHCEQTTIIRFAQQLKYAGFAELKLAIARQSNVVWQDFAEESAPKEQPGDHFRMLCNKLAMLHTESIRETLNGMDESRIDRLVAGGALSAQEEARLRATRGQFAACWTAPGLKGKHEAISGDAEHRGINLIFLK